jgi:hypothetical protein
MTKQESFDYLWDISEGKMPFDVLQAMTCLGVFELRSRLGCGTAGAKDQQWFFKITSYAFYSDSGSRPDIACGKVLKRFMPRTSIDRTASYVQRKLDEQGKVNEMR